LTYFRLLGNLSESWEIHWEIENEGLKTKGGGMKRYQTKYPGVSFRLAERIGGKGLEKVFYIRFTRDGKVIEEKVGRQYADAMTEAKAALIRGERIENKRPSRKEVREARKAKRWTIDALWEDFKEKRGGELKSILRDESRYRHDLKEPFGNKEPREISPLDIDRLRLKLAKGKAPATVRNTLELMRRLINYGIGRNLIDPTKFKIKLPKVNNQTTEDLTPEELGRLLKALDDDVDTMAANLMRLALYTGMRRGELLGLTWDAVDFERGFITIRDPKGGKDQTIPMNAAARAVLENHTRDPESPWVFPGRREGKHATEMRKSINRIRKAAGLPEDFRPMHGLRHVYASMLASSGKVDMFTLQKLLTHKSPLMTQRYAHLRDDAFKRASEVAADILANLPKPSEEKTDGKEVG
jgi:integrase